MTQKAEVVPDPATDTSAPRRRPAARSSIPRLTRPLRVMLVDDHRDFVESLASIVRHMGAKTRCVFTGTAALETALVWRPEAMLVDVGLPDMSGCDVARTMRERYGPNASLIAVTGFAGAEIKRVTLAAGFDAYMQKPVDPRRLHRALQRLCVRP